MAFRQSPNLVASGAIGIITGVAIAGGLLFALSMPATAETPAKTEPANIQFVANQQQRAPGRATNTVEQIPDLDLRTFGNSTARAFALREIQNARPTHAPIESGEVVALNDADTVADRPQS